MNSPWYRMVLRGTGFQFTQFTFSRRIPSITSRTLAPPISPGILFMIGYEREKSSRLWFLVRCLVVPDVGADWRSGTSWWAETVLIGCSLAGGEVWIGEPVVCGSAYTTAYTETVQRGQQAGGDIDNGPCPPVREEKHKIDVSSGHFGEFLAPSHSTLSSFGPTR